MNQNERTVITICHRKTWWTVHSIKGNNWAEAKPVWFEENMPEPHQYRYKQDEIMPSISFLLANLGEKSILKTINGVRVFAFSCTIITPYDGTLFADAFSGKIHLIPSE